MEKELGAHLARLRRDREISQRELALRLAAQGVEVTNQAISKWENGATQPSVTQFLALCTALGVEDISLEFLGSSSALTKGLSRDGVRKLMEFAELLRASGLFREEEKSAKRRILPLYSIAVSAGTGQFLDDSDSAPVEVGADVPANADFGVRVAGDSMLPRYEDGQTVWVHSQETLLSGEIGVFFYDGSAYLKQLLSGADGVCLHSLNPAYTDIKIMRFGELKVLGKAVT